MTTPSPRELCRFARELACAAADVPRLRTLATLVAALALVLGSALVPAAAFPAPTIVPPVIDPGLLPPPNLPPRPSEETEQKSVCQRPVLTGAPPRTVPLAQRQLDLAAAWQFSRGYGQTVAVIDTGVNPHPRLPILIAGGDYVSGSDGLADCDGHGTLVAGLIAARPSPGDGFSGVAPEAAVLGIRQLSLAFEAKDFNRRQQQGDLAGSGYGHVLTLALAVVHAVEMGATVINISEVACAAAGEPVDDGALGAAVKFANDRNVVVVAAAGNLQQNGPCKAQNDGVGWSAAKTVASPAWFSQYVLSVGSVDADGAGSPFSIHGPWVSVAAPGRGIISLDSGPGAIGLVNATPGEKGELHPIDGTSFSSAYVSGVAALVRSRFPALTARQVMDRIIRTAHAPGAGRDDTIGAGMIDPVAALTAQLPMQPVEVGATLPKPVAAPPPLAREDPWPKQISAVGTLACLGVLGVGYAMSIPYRRDSRRRKLSENVDY
ncbi:type VII secretion-associated serine protease mycosin [Nocardia sp. KC 131]|uniref:type VII secretion-associated serine protease mycosin n=1 Tax=Nocardia arseniciresistens TaxID=3392119 RepID=UPI00398E9E0C